MIPYEIAVPFAPAKIRNSQAGGLPVSGYKLFKR